MIDWSPLYAASHVDEMVSHFTASLIEIFDRLAPITCRRVSRPWLNDAVRRLIEETCPSGDLNLLWTGSATRVGGTM